MKTTGSIILLAILTATSMNSSAQKSELTGAWHMSGDNSEHSLIIEDGFFFHTNYSKTPKSFIFSQGGTYTLNGKSIKAKLYFNTEDKERVGSEMDITFVIRNESLEMEVNGEKRTWKRVDNGTGDLAGMWRITGRMQDGKLAQIHQTGPRQTYKILSGTRFQWAAINPETKEFSGTGGGTYTFENGKYTENIEFFSRDNNRVGASLSFDGKLENGQWHHSGLSSKGDEIYEVWSKAK